MAAEQEDPRLTLPMNNYQIIINTPDIDLKTERTNSTAKGREEDTLEKLGNEELWFGRETDHGCLGREGAAVVEKGERQTVH